MTINLSAEPPQSWSCCLIKLQVRNRCQLQNGRFYRGPHPPRYAPYVSTPTSKPVRPHINTKHLVPPLLRSRSGNLIISDSRTISETLLTHVIHEQTPRIFLEKENRPYFSFKHLFSTIKFFVTRSFLFDYVTLPWRDLDLSRGQNAPKGPDIHTL